MVRAKTPRSNRTAIVGKTIQTTRGRPKRHSEKPNIRATLLDAAEALVCEEGYAAATARRIASRAGLKHQVIFYYFGSLDDLLLALLRRVAESNRAHLDAALNSAHPLRAMWNVIKDPSSTRFTLEFMALANHNDAVRAELAANAEAVRALQAEAVTRHLQQRGIKPRLSPQLVSILTTALARLLVQEAALRIRAGHREAEALVDTSLRRFEATGETAAEVATVVEAMSHPRTMRSTTQVQ